MPKKGYKQTEEHRHKLIVSHKKRYEKHPELREKISAANKVRVCTAETRARMSAASKNKSVEHRAKLSMASKNRSQETRAKISAGNKGKFVSDETRAKMGAAKTGDKSHWWKGGVSFFPYCEKFNRQRKRACRNFFGNHCICCGKHVTENITGVKRCGQKALSVHHIDHDKEQGCSGKPFNLVPLCGSCHALEINSEEEYKQYINNALREGFKWGVWNEEEYTEKVMF